MKISSSFWRFPGSEWESATLSPNFHFFHFFIMFFSLPLFLMVFHCFSLFSMAFLDFRCHGQGKWKNNEKKENFLEFLKISWFGVRICNFESKFSFCFHLQLHVFSFSFVFDGFPLFFIVFHGFPGFQVPRERKMKKTWTFPRVFEDFLVRSENLQLWVQIFIFFSFATSFFFMFLCFWWFSIVFHCFSWFSWISGATGKENEKKMKNMKISSSFWRFPGSEWESATLNPNFHVFFICNFIFFSFSFVFDGFSIVFHGFPGFQVPRERKMKKNENFLEFLKISWFGVRICNFESKFSFFFHLQLHFFSFSFVFWWFSIVFHCFSWFSWISGATGKENEKNMIKKMKFKMKKQWSLKWKKWCLKWKKWSLEKQKTKKKYKKKLKKWKNKNKKMIEKQHEKMKLQMKTQMKNKWKNNFKHFQSVARCESYNTNSKRCKGLNIVWKNRR